MTMSVVGVGPDSNASSRQKDLMNQLRIFLEGAGKDRTANLRMSSIALNLLRNLPGARDAVFEYYTGIFERMLSNYSPQSEVQSNISAEEEAVLSELQEVLSSSVESNPRSWAPLVSKWSLDTLGKLSYQFGGKMAMKKGGDGKGKDGKGKEMGKGKSAGTLHETVSAWLGCAASRFLIEISAECLAKQIDDDSEGCISALLETSTKHAPYLDWVVAHLGSCFPHTLIKRVLSLGLKDFMSIAPNQIGQEGCVSLMKVPKLISVMNILTHLGRNHANVLQESIHELLLGSLTEEWKSDEVSTVPYILHLAVLSQPLSRALVHNLVDLVTPAVMERIVVLVPTWANQFFRKEGSFLDLLTQILLSTDRDSGDVLVLLLELGVEEGTPISKGSRILFNSLLAALFNQVHGVSRHRGEGIPVLENLNPNLSVLLHMLLSDQVFLRSSAVQLLTLYALHKGRSVTIQILNFLLFSSSTDQDLAVLSNFLSRVEIFHYNCINDLVAQCLRNRNGKEEKLLRNLTKLVEVEKSGEREYRSSFTQAVRTNLGTLAEKLTNPGLVQPILHLFRLVPVERRMRVKKLHRVCHCLVQVYLATLIKGGEGHQRILHLVETVLRELCKQKTVLQIVLRFLLQIAINSPYAQYLQSQENDSLKTVKSTAAPNKLTSRLFEENFKFGSMPVQPLGHSTVFHAGIIGDGKRPAEAVHPLGEFDRGLLRETLAGTIFRLCESVDDNDEGAKKLALILVELISPDIMYNGIPWPEEEFIKVTMERDLCITRTLTLHPVLWKLLELLANKRPSLSYCSVIVRAIVSVSITHWQSSVCARITEQPNQMEVTRRVIELMGAGQFIPKQLSVLSQILHLLDPSQIHCILIDIWNYMRVNVPGPNMFEACPQSGVVYRDFGPYENYKPYCDRLRMVMIGRIEEVSQLFKMCFVDSLKNKTHNGAVNGNSEPVPRIPATNQTAEVIELN